MNYTRYTELLNDEKVINFSEWSGKDFISKNNKLVVTFSFRHGGYSSLHFPDPINRITLTVFPLEKLNVHMRLLEIEDEVLILANADDENYALSYILKVNEETNSATVIINDYPEDGTEIITEIEKTGLNVFSEK